MESFPQPIMSLYWITTDSGDTSISRTIHYELSEKRLTLESMHYFYIYKDTYVTYGVMLVKVVIKSVRRLSIPCFS